MLPVYHVVGLNTKCYPPAARKYKKTAEVTLLTQDIETLKAVIISIEKTVTPTYYGKLSRFIRKKRKISLSVSLAVVDGYLWSIKLEPRVVCAHIPPQLLYVENLYSTSVTSTYHPADKNRYRTP